MESIKKAFEVVWPLFERGGPVVSLVMMVLVWLLIQTVWERNSENKVLFERLIQCTQAAAQQMMECKK